MRACAAVSLSLSSLSQAGEDVARVLHELVELRVGAPLGVLVREEGLFLFGYRVERWLFGVGWGFGFQRVFCVPLLPASADAADADDAQRNDPPRTIPSRAHLQVRQLVEHEHVELVVLLRRQVRGAQLPQHRGGVAEGLPQVVLVLCVCVCVACFFWGGGSMQVQRGDSQRDHSEASTLPTYTRPDGLHGRRKAQGPPRILVDSDAWHTQRSTHHRLLHEVCVLLHRVGRLLQELLLVLHHLEGRPLGRGPISGGGEGRKEGRKGIGALR